MQIRPFPPIEVAYMRAGGSPQRGEHTPETRASSSEVEFTSGLSLSPSFHSIPLSCGGFFFSFLLTERRYFRVILMNGFGKRGGGGGRSRLSSGTKRRLLSERRPLSLILPFSAEICGFCGFLLSFPLGANKEPHVSCMKRRLFGARARSLA